MLKKLLICLFVLFTGINSKGQFKCQIKNLSITEKDLMATFLNEFKTAVLRNDTLVLKKLFKFPFTCSFCFADSAKNYPGPYKMITLKSFESDGITYILTTTLKDALKSSDFRPEILQPQGNYKTKARECTYSFVYKYRGASKYGEGQQRVLDITRTNSGYKITGMWMIP